jgi:hypothetical protein
MLLDLASEELSTLVTAQFVSWLRFDVEHYAQMGLRGDATDDRHLDRFEVSGEEAGTAGSYGGYAREKDAERGAADSLRAREVH